MSSSTIITTTTVKGPQDPLTLSTPIPPSYPITANNLHETMEYHRTPMGQLSIRSAGDFSAGTHLCYITTHTPAPIATWATLQTSKTTHIELNNALLYINHSCAPNVEWHVYSPDAAGDYPNGRAGEVKVARDRGLQKGDELFWFYPSAEWASPRPFQCICGQEECIRWQRGSQALSERVLNNYFVNEHVKELVRERDVEDVQGKLESSVNISVVAVEVEGE